MEGIMEYCKHTRLYTFQKSRSIAVGINREDLQKKPSSMQAALER